MRRSTLRTVALTVIFFSVCLFAQQLEANPPSSGPDSGTLRYVWLHYDNASGERGISTFDGKSDTPAVSLWELLDGTRYSINYLSYDDRGNLILKVRYFSEGRVSKNTYQHDENNNLVAEQYERSDGRTGSSQYIYENGRLIRAEHNGHNGWLFATLEFRYSDAGQKTRALVLSEGDSAGVVTYDYDEQGNLAGEAWNFVGGWYQNFRREYAPVPDSPVSCTSANPFIRDLSAVRVASEEYDYSGKVGGPSIYEYDGGSNRLLHKRYVRSDGLETVTTYIYHPEGRLLRSYRSYADGRTGFFRFEYDDRGNLARKTFFTSDTTSGSESYQYDGQGRLVSADYVNVDAWLTGKLTFEHDRKGRLKRGHFTGDDGLNAEITFKMDKRNNPTRIHWKFSNGATQTYKFTYEPAS